MKQKTILSIILFNLIAFTAFGQTNIKVGFADIEYILGNMPETAKAQADLDVILDKLQKTRDSIVTDYNVKMEDYKKTETTLIEAVKKKTQTDLLRIEQGIQGFEVDMQTAIDYKKNELLRPIYKRIGELIRTVAKENNFTHIINSEIDGNSIILYAEESTDISDLVIAKAKM
ncbi:OmpH family outer membrane protein [Lacinutrix jangbogonensis]|uniref:OmpH family outer membrane protein n=1 Tax=Lacinutrix jangbogonensis TaxID=1469557 RepID=UPI00053E2620|nr:OmpH family outer membrane protein [Lacinutrix jangbogonensis]